MRLPKYELLIIGIESIIEKLVKARLVPSGWIDSIEISDFSKYGFKVPSVDPISLFLRPSFQLTLFGDSALCFGAKYYYNDEPVFSDPRFRLPSYRGILYKFQGYASDKVRKMISLPKPCPNKAIRVSKIYKSRFGITQSAATYHNL